MMTEAYGSNGWTGFTHAKAYLDFFKVVEEARANREQPAPFAAWWWNMEPARTLQKRGTLGG